ncbi:TetR/AcrR family transcriptional regulator [Streptomyces asiaticus]|uniref:TetR/AcrR family transcriptional regulator n=1 Tax=Streptomyces asiaticus TaxID=114695 RepID=UPI003824E252
MRSDTERNRRHLIKAAARLFENSPTPVSLAEIAKHAEVSTATAYRHFSSVEEVLHAFRARVGSELRDFSAAQTTRGMRKLDAVSRYWVSLVLEHGGAMAQMRSHRGYLERLREGTGYLAPQAEALTEPLRQTAAELGLGDLGDEALYLWNALFDPRDILDLIKSGRTEDGVRSGLFPTEGRHRLKYAVGALPAPEARLVPAPGRLACERREQRTWTSVPTSRPSTAISTAGIPRKRSSTRRHTKSYRR